MEFKSELFHPTKIKIELTSFENFENELFTIFMKKNFNTCIKQYALIDWV
jgi:hypothetical protein